MCRFVSVLFLGLISIALGFGSASAQSAGDAMTLGRMGTVTFTLDGRTHTSSVRAYMVDEVLFLNGIWVQDSTVRFGRAGLASTFLLRFKGAVGSHPVVVSKEADAGAGALLSILYGGSVAGRMYEILRSDAKGGEGNVVVNTLSGDNATGTFELTAYDKNDPDKKKQVVGSFEVDFKKIGGERR